jgi:hypothetical protein
MRLALTPMGAAVMGGRRAFGLNDIIAILGGSPSLVALVSQPATLFSDRAGTTAAVLEGPVGYWQDLSGGGKHLQAPSDGARPTLSARYNLLLNTATLSTQNVTTIAAGYTLSFSGAGTVTLSGTATAGPLSAGTHTFTATAGTLTVTVSGVVSAASIVLTIHAALPYQWVTDGSASGYDTSAVYPRYLRANGIGNAMQTVAAVAGSASDKATVFAGVTHFALGADTIVEHSASISANAGAFTLRTGDAAGNASSTNYFATSRGAAALNSNQGVESTAFNRPHSAVLVAAHDIAGDSTTFAVNGVSQTPASGDKGAGNFGNYVIYFCSRGSTTLWFDGDIYSLIQTFKPTGLTDSEIAAIERFLAAEMKGLVTLP